MASALKVPILVAAGLLTSVGLARAAPEEGVGADNPSAPIESTTPGVRLDGKAEANPVPTPEQELTAKQEEKPKKPWNVSASVSYRGLLILDEDARNDMRLSYGVKGSYAFFPGAAAFVGTGVDQFFTQEDGDSPVRFTDTKVGAGYEHEVELSGQSVKACFNHRLQFWLPTSRVNRLRGLFVAPALFDEAALCLPYGATVGVSSELTYLFQRYAEQKGQYGGMNPRLGAEFRLGAGLTPLDSERYGRVSIGLEASTHYTLKYRSRSTYTSQASSDQQVVQQYGWGASVSYAPISYATLAVAVRHGGLVRNDGIIHLYAVKRENTELLITLTGAY